MLNLVCFPPCVVMFPCLFYVFCCCDSSSLLFLIIVTFLDFLLSIFFFSKKNCDSSSLLFLKNILIFFYQSSCSGPLKKIRFVSEKSSKISFFFLFWKKIILFFGNQFFSFVFHAWSRKHFAIFCVFNPLFGMFFASLCLSPKKNSQKWLILLPDSFSLYVYYRYVYPPCCCSSCWQKNGLKNCVLLLSFAHFSKTSDKNIVFISETSSFFLLLLFSSIQERHFCEQIPFILELSLLSFLKKSSVF